MGILALIYSVIVSEEMVMSQTQLGGGGFGLLCVNIKGCVIAGHSGCWLLGKKTPICEVATVHEELGGKWRVCS